MLELRVFGAIYRDWIASISDGKGQACGFARYTPVHTIRCRYVEEVPEMFVDLYGHELGGLHGDPYLYIQTEHGCLRITE